MLTPAPTAMIRFFGLTADSRKPRPSALTKVKLSIAAIHFGVSWVPPRPRHWRRPTINSNTPSPTLTHEVPVEEESSVSSTPASAVKMPWRQ